MDTTYANLLLCATSDDYGNPRKVAVILNPRTNRILASSRVGFASPLSAFHELYVGLTTAGVITATDCDHNVEVVSQNKWFALAITTRQYRAYRE